MPRGDANVAKLTQEVKLMARLSHPNIVEYLGADLDESEGVLSIYQEWVPGGSVDHLLKKFGGSLPDAITRRYAREVALGLAYLHDNLIVHRDVKASNAAVAFDRTFSDASNSRASSLSSSSFSA